MNGRLLMLAGLKPCATTPTVLEQDFSPALRMKFCAGILLLLWLVVGGAAVFAQAQTFPVSGTVRTSAGAPVEGASISVDPSPTVVARTDGHGRFTVALAPGPHVLRINHPSCVTGTTEVNVTGATTGVAIVLDALARFSEDVTVTAVRADAEAPMTTRDINRREIETLNAGQEMPFLLKQVPSITQYSDSGSATGYSTIYLRGIPQSRMNITLDGVPLNEPEDSAFYFANFGDFANALGSLQVQRGVGTSTVGAASFVGSINFASLDFTDRPKADVRLGGGSFGTHRVSAALNSGQLSGGLRLYGQAAFQDADGFREHAGMTQKSLYVGASRETGASFFKVFGFAGHEQSQLSYLAADEATLDQDLRSNPMSPDERDRFTQRFLTVQYHRAITPASEFAVQGYYNSAGGWYRIEDVMQGLLQYGLDWQNIGVTASYHVATHAVDFTWGGHANDFGSHHARDIVDGAHQYTNRGFKNEVSSFAKIGHTAGRWHHYGDVQVRWARFRYDGDLDLGSVSWTFVNPKVGTRFALNHGLSLYGSIGQAQREPGRSDMLQGEDNPTVVYDLRAVKPERVVNVETGLDLTRPGLSVRANAFFMEFQDEIAQTGELSETYLPLRRNVDRSFRRGMELDLTWRPSPAVTLRHSATYSYSRIRSWTQFYDVYDAAGNWIDSTSRTRANVAPLLTPSVLLNVAADYTPAPWVTLGAAGRYVGEVHLDNTGSATFTAPGFFGLDADASVDLSRALRFAAAAAPRLRIQATNLLDNRRMFPSGYSYRYFTQTGAGGLDPAGSRYFYPLATRSVFVMLDLKF
ncbi:MAG: TonB-dependent receptor [Acidobacteria bacterium]|nr:TonB-dependent receptor [Acidobacteriota bacterium]